MNAAFVKDSTQSAQHSKNAFISNATARPFRDLA